MYLIIFLFFLIMKIIRDTNWPITREIRIAMVERKRSKLFVRQLLRSGEAKMAARTVGKSKD